MNILAGAEGGALMAAITIADRLRVLLGARADLLSQLARCAPASTRVDVLLMELETNAIQFAHLGSVMEILQPGVTRVNPPPMLGL
jgi:hypothetical protein